MRRFYSLSMNSERKSEISSEEIEDFDTDNEGDLYYDDDLEEDEYGDDEPEEREYCD